MITVELSQQKDLDSDPKANQQIDVTEQLKSSDSVNADGNEFKFVLTILEKNQTEITNILSGSCNSLIKDVKS